MRPPSAACTSVPWGMAMLMPSLWVPSGRLPKEAMTRPRAGQRNLPGVAAAVAAGDGATAGAGSLASLRWVPMAAVFCSPAGLITRGWLADGGGREACAARGGVGGVANRAGAESALALALP